MHKHIVHVLDKQGREHSNYLRTVQTVAGELYQAEIGNKTFPSSMESVRVCACVCECVLFAALSGVGGLICSSNIDRQGLGMRSFLQGVLLPSRASTEMLTQRSTQTHAVHTQLGLD